MDLDPFEPVGIGAETIRFLDLFLLHCLHAESRPTRHKRSTPAAATSTAWPHAAASQA